MRDHRAWARDGALQHASGTLADRPGPIFHGFAVSLI